MNTVKDLREVLSEEARRLQPPAGLEMRVLQQALRSSSAVAPARRPGRREAFRSWGSISEETPRLMVFTAALLAIAVIVTLVLTGHALHLARSVPAKPGPPGGVHSISVKPGPPGGIREAIPIKPPAVLCSALSATYGCSLGRMFVFGSASVGWMAAANSEIAEGPTNLYRSDDGGKHWFAQLSWDYSGADEIKVSPDGSEALIIGGWDWQGPALFHTTDGGSHWTSLGFPLSPQQAAAVAIAPPQIECNPKEPTFCAEWPGYFPTGQIYFLNPREGWVLSQEPTFGVADLFHTTDSGAHWALSARIDLKAQFGLDLATGLSTPLPTLVPSGKGGVPTVDHQLHGQLVFQNSSAGWFIPDYSFYPAMSLSVFRTLDGGASWKLQTIEPPQGINLSNGAIVGVTVKFFNDQQGVAISGRGYAYTTSDGGTSWSHPNPIPTDIEAGTIGFIDAQDWVAWSTTSDVMGTSDAGQHWKLVGPPLPAPGWQQGAFDFVDPSHGWVYTGVYLFSTSDGGVHWVMLPLPSTG